MACEILPTCWKLSRGSQCRKALLSPAEDKVGQALAAMLLVAFFFFLYHGIFGTRAVPGMVKMSGNSCGGWYGLGKTPSSCAMLFAWILAFPLVLLVDFHLLPAPSPRFFPILGAARGGRVGENGMCSLSANPPCLCLADSCGRREAGVASPCSCHRQIHWVKNSSFCSLPCEMGSFPPPTPTG